MDEKVQIVEQTISSTEERITVINDAFARFVVVDIEGLHVSDNQNSSSEILIDSNSVNIRNNGHMASKFTGSYIQFGNYLLRQTADGGLAFKLKEWWCGYI